jgi:predicted nucleic acid-binding protein
MNTTVTFDSGAWIEYFAGTLKGKNVKKYIDENTNIFTPSICLLEIKNKYMREGHKYQDQIEFICNISSTIDLSKEIALKGADIKFQFNLYTIDAIVYASAQIKKSTLLTTDHHFKDLKNVELLL